MAFPRVGRPLATSEQPRVTAAESKDAELAVDAEEFAAEFAVVEGAKANHPKKPFSAICLHRLLHSLTVGRRSPSSLG